MNPSPTVFDTNVIQERISFASRGRTLEGLLAYGCDSDPAFSALIAGPHPFMGGDLDNNVVHALVASLAANGGLTLAFNYSGVGNSQGGSDDWHKAASQFWETGTIDQESAWIDDALAARDTLIGMGVTPAVEIGYSFGCRVIAEMRPLAECAGRVLISPNPRRHRFDSLATCRAPLLVLHSSNDFACPPGDTRTWFEGLQGPKSLQMIDASEHFFRGQEGCVLHAVVEFLASEGIS